MVSVRPTPHPPSSPSLSSPPPFPLSRPFAEIIVGGRGMGGKGYWRKRDGRKGGWGDVGNGGKGDGDMGGMG